MINKFSLAMYLLFLFIYLNPLYATETSKQEAVASSEELLISWAYGNASGWYGHIVLIGSLDSSGSFNSALSNASDSISNDSVTLAGFQENTRNVEWISIDSSIVLTSSNPSIVLGNELMECVEYTNFVELAVWDSLSPTGAYFFSQYVNLANYTESSIDSTFNIDSLTPLDSQTISQVEEYEHNYSEVFGLEPANPSGIRYEFSDWKIYDYRFNRWGCNSCPVENKGERLILYNNEKVWPLRNCYFYVSHASGGTIDCITEEYSPWYEWNGNLFCITFQYQAQYLSCSVLVINSRGFTSYEVFNYSPDCG